ncbi:hypothetical protein BKA70DRAFT_1379527 [Coprinopsis sp. MPI-PUGE-AT-0042]|nr:hypothetical protein BKA70DRAFT_1379527 [Coprinopsis sp. MPI-PUGE-AT-0042]
MNFNSGREFDDSQNTQQQSRPDSPRPESEQSFSYPLERNRSGKRPQEDPLKSGPRKRPCRTDPLVHHGRHFGRTIQAFCQVQLLLKQGLACTIQLDLGRITEEDLGEGNVNLNVPSPECFSELQEHRIYKRLLALSPTLEERLCTGSEQELFHIADMISKGASSACSNDTKSLKSVIVDWITPPNGVLLPPLQRNIKTDRGFYHDRTGELLCPVNLDWSDAKVREQLRSGEIVPTEDQWPRFLYQNHILNPEDPWEGLFRGGLLVSAFKHVFTSPSSVNSKEPWATRSCNARIHGMQSVTVASIAYIASQVRFGLSSSPVFSRTDLETDSESFYASVIILLEDPEEQDEVRSLLAWWDRQVFPRQINTRPVHKDSVLCKIKKRRRRLNELALNGSNGQTE